MSLAEADLIEITRDPATRISGLPPVEDVAVVARADTTGAPSYYFSFLIEFSSLIERGPEPRPLGQSFIRQDWDKRWFV